MVDRSGSKSKRGFAAMSPEKQREIASKGGKAVPPEKRSFSKDTQLAAEAGKAGGKNVKAENRTFSRDTLLAQTAGQKGRGKRKAKGQEP